jgi:hypothetical protein
LRIWLDEPEAFDIEEDAGTGRRGNAESFSPFPVALGDFLRVPQIWALARNFALNAYRDQGFKNMAQAQRRCGFSLSTLKQFFRMK